MRMDTKERTEDTGLEKKKQTRRLLLFCAGIIAVTGVIFVTMFMNTVKKLQYVYTNRAYQDTVSLKSEAVDRTVEDIAGEVDVLRAVRLRDEEGVIKSLAPSIRAILDQESGREIDALKEFFAGTEGLNHLTCVAMEEKSGKILLDEKGFAGEAGVWSDDLETFFVVFERVTAGGLTVVYGITGSALESEMQEIMEGRLKTLNRNTGTMYWIDRISVLDNGKVRKVRVIDPENPKRSGMTLDSRGVGNGPWNFATDGLMTLTAGMCRRKHVPARCIMLPMSGRSVRHFAWI